MQLPRQLGKYVLRREIGRGSMGVVYEGYDTVIQRRIALKLIRHDDVGSGTQAQQLLQRLRQEAQAAGRLSHPGIVAIHDFGEASDESGLVAFIAMEFVEGRELRAWTDTGRRFSPSDAVAIVGEILQALQHAHQRGVTHRDIKPANIMMLADGRPKLTDFGVARIDTSELTQTGMTIGTPMYMSPEQVLGLTADGRSDLFSCGVVLYELLTGAKPFTGSIATIVHKVLEVDPEPPSKLNVSLAPVWDTFIATALAKKPEQRFQTADAMLVALRAALLKGDDGGDATLAPGTLLSAREPPPPTVIGAAPVSALPAQPRAPGRGRVAAMALAGAATVGGLAWWYATRDHDQPPVPAGPVAGGPAPAASAAASTSTNRALPLSSATVAAAGASVPATATKMPDRVASGAAASGRKGAPSSAPPPVDRVNEWSDRQRSEYYAAAPAVTTLAVALSRLLQPLGAAEQGRLYELEAQIVALPKPYVYVLGVSQGRLVHAWSSGRVDSLAEARRVCVDLYRTFCRSVTANGVFERENFAAVARELGERPLSEVRRDWSARASSAIGTLRRDSDARRASAASVSPTPGASAPSVTAVPANPPPGTTWTEAVARLDAAPLPKGLGGAMQRVLEPLGPNDASQLQELDRLLAQQEPGFMLGMQAQGGYLYVVHARGPGAEAELSQGCRTCRVVVTNGELRRDALGQVLRGIGDARLADVRAAWMLRVGGLSEQLRRPPVSASRPAVAAVPSGDWAPTVLRLRLATPLNVADALIALLGAETSFDLEQLRKVAALSASRKGHAMLAMGVTPEGGLAFGFAHDVQTAAMAESQAVEQCRASASDCRPVALNGYVYKDAFVDVAGKLGKLPPSVVRDNFTRALARALPGPRG